MKKVFSLLLLVFMTISIVGCGKNEEKPKEQDKPISTEIKFLDDKRETKEFEALEDFLVLTMEQANVKYILKVFFKNDKASNAVMQMQCPDEEMAMMFYTSYYNDKTIDELVIDGKVVTLDYNKEFPYAGLDKETTKTMLLGQGYN